MDIKIAQKRVDDLAAAMVVKGMRSPAATLMMKANSQPCLHLAWADKSQTYGESYDCFHGDTVVEAFEAANEFVANRPTLEQANLNEFMAALGKVIDLGKDNGIKVDFLNPLVATMKRLSENIITDQRAA